MKKNLFLCFMLCAAYTGFAQVAVEVDNAGNVGIGSVPLSNAKFYLHNSINANGTNYGFYSNSTLNAPSSGTIYGAYLKNTTAGSSGRTVYGIRAENSDASGAGSMYGLYLSNTKGGQGSTCGIYSTNVSAANAPVYGAYFSVASTATTWNIPVYGIYSNVSSTTGIRYSGYFTGGKVVVNDNIHASGFITLTSDERLKSNIKSLYDEKDKLYLLEGKSYLKTLPPPAKGLEDDSLAEKRGIIEFPEYGYLAQELKEIFPDLVSQDDSAGYYSVNYIGLIPIIVEALKDQKLENEKQREQIKQLVKLIDIKYINEKVFEESGIESIPILLQNTPNPFNQATEIGYYIPESVNSANIYIYDINGFQEKNISISGRGKGATTLQAAALRAGIYFYTLICDGKPVDTKQMILTR